tara:strand:+ start:189 stop:314 length:126 start_codon:yes stop_codon:yes gene_type:complete
MVGRGEEKIYRLDKNKRAMVRLRQVAKLSDNFRDRAKAQRR